MRINLRDIEENIKPLGQRLSYDKEFIYDLLAVYGRSTGNITRLRNGQLNVAGDRINEVAQKSVIYFKPTDDSPNLYTIIDDLRSSPLVVRYATRFVIVTDYEHLLAVDTKTGETLDISIRDINKHYTFFLPWAGMEKTQYIAENHADVKAAEKMAKLFDILVAHNGYTTADEWHDLTTFFTRLLFCFFAEDTNIFQKNQFVNSIASYTQEDGSDLKDFLKVLFASLDDKDKTGYPAYLAEFPYVNGQLFSNFSAIPDFNKEARNLLIESSSKLDWSDINPDIFGSMFQAVVRPGDRTGLGQHYTSVPNIMKTIEPLFLDDLKEEFDNSYDDTQKLNKLLVRIGDIKFIDPACGSGNFLIITYKELRRLEHAILERQGDLTGHTQSTLLGSRINIENFYGIEIDDFAQEVAVLSLWLAKHQMNLEFAEKFGIDLPLIPLKEAGNIIQGNSARIDWNDVMPISDDTEAYVIGNPPYLGGKGQSKEQKQDLKLAFEKYGNYKELDYIAIWFIKAAEYAKRKTKISFVTTSSVNQGSQVEQLWPKIFILGLEIIFAYLPFTWSNNAKGKAGVSCSIIGLGFESGKKTIISGQFIANANNINGYLLNAPNLIIKKSNDPISNLPKIITGNTPYDGTHLMLNREERNKILDSDPLAEKFIRKAMGAGELTKRIDRWCVWISPKDVDEAMAIPLIADRIEEVRKYRVKGGDVAKSLLAHPYRFRYTHTATKSSIIIPIVSSSRRKYMPADIIDKDTIIIGSAAAIYDPEPWVFGIVSSLMHMTWVKVTAGRLREDLRYLSALSYNTFPIPALSSTDKEKITEMAYHILDVRENHSDKTLSELYDPDKMPDDLRIAHQELDEVVEGLYRKKPFESDEERLTHLFDLYEAMTVSNKGDA